ncbi:hypothetical protein KAR91_41515, partial [Candidatus Pacearchaeota archaeon]|nr:hypothetical protein [Candidatus Pacearchaeota archaeon]
NIDKTSMLADGSDTINISDLPNKTIIELDGQVFEIDDGIFTFTIDTPGTHKLKVRTGIDLPEEIEINAS